MLALLLRGIATALAIGACIGGASASDDAAAGRRLVTAQTQQNLYGGTGVVTDVNEETGSLTVNHEDIPGLMPKMEMLFRVEPQSLSKGVRAGDKIEFSVEAKTYKIRELKVVESAK